MLRITKIKIISCLSGLGFIALALFVVLGPFVSLLGIQSSLKSENEEALTCYIDFPRLQDNLKIQMSKQAQESFGFSENGGMLAQFAMQVANQIIDISIESAVSPMGISMMLSGEELDKLMLKTKSTSAEENDSGSQEGIAGQEQLAKQEQSSWLNITNSEFEYMSHDRFVFYLPASNQEKESTQLIFLRSGISWKLSNVIFG